MKKKLLPILLLVALLFTRSEVWAANTHSADFEFDSSQYLSRVDGVALSITGDVTVEAWAKLESISTVDGEHPTIVAKGTLVSGSDYAMYSLQYCPVTSCGVGRWRAFFRKDAGVVTQTITYDHVPTVGTWYHVAASRDNDDGSMIFCLDGTQVASEGGETGTIVDNAIDLGIGGAGGGTAGKFWDGQLDDIRIWNVEKTCAEINTSKGVELVGNEAGLVAYYKLNNSLLDETVNDLDLTNNNSVTFSTDVPFGAESAVAARIDDYQAAADVLMLID